MGNDRLYTEKEISKILKRAGEVQASKSAKVTVGLSLEELQQIAEEVGLEPDIVAQVADEIDTKPEEDEKGFFSSLLMPTKLDIEQVIPIELNEDQWPEIVSMIERAVGKSGSSSQIGRMMEWTSDGRHSVHKFSLIPGDEQTKVIYQGTFSQLALSWTLPILINVAVWAFIGSMLAFSWAGIPLGMLITFATYLIIRSGFNGFLKSKKQSVKSVFAKMKGLVSGRKSGTKSAKTSVKPSIQIPGEDEMEDNSGVESVRKKVK